MSVGVIQARLGGGQYEVQQKVDRTLIESRITAIDVRLGEIDGQLTGLQTYIDNLLSQINGLIDQLPGVAASGDADALTELNDEVMDLQSRLAKHSRQRALLVTEQVALQTDKARLESIPDMPVVTAISADRFNSFRVGREVAIADINGVVSADASPLLIAPTGDGVDVAPDASDGIAGHLEQMSGAGYGLALALGIGARTWVPKYSEGVIVELDLDNHVCTVEFNADYSRSVSQRLLENGVPVNGFRSQTRLTDIPIQYRTCDALAFVLGDYVLVEFIDGTPVVVGFTRNPRYCLDDYDESRCITYMDTLSVVPAESLREYKGLTQRPLGNYWFHRLLVSGCRYMSRSPTEDATVVCDIPIVRDVRKIKAISTGYGFEYGMTNYLDEPIGLNVTYADGRFDYENFLSGYVVIPIAFGASYTFETFQEGNWRAANFWEYGDGVVYYGWDSLYDEAAIWWGVNQGDSVQDTPPYYDHDCGTRMAFGLFDGIAASDTRITYVKDSGPYAEDWPYQTGFHQVTGSFQPVPDEADPFYLQNGLAFHFSIAEVTDPGSSGYVSVVPEYATTLILYYRLVADLPALPTLWMTNNDLLAESGGLPLISLPSGYYVDLDSDDVNTMVSDFTAGIALCSYGAFGFWSIVGYADPASWSDVSLDEAREMTQGDRSNGVLLGFKANTTNTFEILGGQQQICFFYPPGPNSGINQVQIRFKNKDIDEVFTVDFEYA